MGDLPLDDKVWVPHEQKVWELADVVTLSKDKTELIVEVGAEEDGSLTQKRFKVADTLTYDLDHERDLSNVFEMGAMNSAGLMALLKRRSVEDNIYTFIGDILLAVNPYTEIEGLYEPIPANLDESTPHVYSIASKAYHEMLNNGLRGKSQSILINGESGAGKTESAKRIMSFLADRSQAKRKELASKSRMMGMRGKGMPMRSSIKLPGLFGKRGGQQSKSNQQTGAADGGAARDVSQMEESIMQTNPVLEAFGNAQTIRNDNSSRFGKFVQLEYSKEGVITGAKTLHFLLEKSRIVSHAYGERNYHIFYQVCAAAERDPHLFHGFDLASWNSYRYLCPSVGAPKKGSRESNSGKRTDLDLSSFDHVQEALDSLGVEVEERRDIWRVLAAILALGNIQFTNLRTKSGEDLCTVDLRTKEGSDNFALTAKLLGVESDALLEAFSKRTVRAGGRASVSIVPLTTREAEGSRDGLAKAIYQALFEWLVRRLNVATSQASGDVGSSSSGRGPSLTRGGRSKTPPQPLYIGVLDIFGFEILEFNSFEQLCINYTNEVLQGMFDDHVFQLELDSLSAEGVSCPSLAFRDNVSLLNLLDSKPSGIFQLLDEQGALGARGSDPGFLKALKASHGADPNSRLVIPKQASTTFQIVHFAGHVTYNTEGLVNKNSDHLQPDLMDLITKSVKDQPPQPVERSRRNTLLSFRNRGKSKSSSSINSVESQSSGAGSKGDPLFPLGFAFLQRILITSPSNNAKAADDNVIKAGRVTRRKNSKPADEPAERSTRKMAKLESVSARFRKQMKNLRDHLNSTMLHFVRCIKPNERKQPRLWDAPMIATQLRMLGILEMVRVRHEGFPVRIPYADVLAKYPELLEGAGISWKAGDGTDRQALVQLLYHVFGPDSKGHGWQMGETKCFMLESSLKLLDHQVRVKREENETARELLERRRKARILQKQQRAAADRIAAVYRGHVERMKFADARRAAQKLQSVVRSRKHAREFKEQKAAATTLASFSKMVLARKRLNAMRAFVKLQALWRGVQVRSRWEVILRNRHNFQHLLRPNECVVHFSTVIRSRGLFSKVGRTYFLVFTSGPSPRLLLVTQDYRLREEIPWKGSTTCALASSGHKLVIHSDTPVTAEDLIQHQDKSASTISKMLSASRRKLRGKKKPSSSSPSTAAATGEGDHVRRFTLTSSSDNAFHWLLMLQDPYHISSLMNLVEPFEVLPLSSENSWAFGGPGVAGGMAPVHLAGTFEWTQSKNDWRLRYFVLKGTSLFWFKSQDSHTLPLGGLNLNELCTVKKTNGKKHKYCVELSSPLFNEPLRLSFETERIRKHWLAQFKKAIKRRAEGFKRHTLSRGYMNSTSWKPVKEALSIAEADETEDESRSDRERRPTEDFEQSEGERDD